MINRREFVGLAVGAGAGLALTPQLLSALQQSGGTLIQRAIPSSGEMLPVIGLSRGNVPVDDTAFKEVLKTLVDNGGRVLDTVHGWAIADEAAFSAASELGVQNDIFWSTQVRAPAGSPGVPGQKIDPAVARAEIETSFARLRVPRIDLIHAHVMRDVPTYLAILRELKQEGRVRYIGVTAAFPNQHAALESVMRNEPIDFISIDYAADNRNVEQTILPLAQERKIGVVACFPFGGGAGPNQTVTNRLFQRVGTTPLPDWAADFDATTWGQFFLKYVVSHPAVTVVRAGTSKPHHMLDNIGGGVGRLPDEATRKRMAEFVDTLPAAPSLGPPPQQQAAQGSAVALSAAVLDRYVGEYKAASGPATFTFRRDGAALFVNPGPNAPLVARSETRFSFAGPGPVFEFQLDAQGRVTGAILEQGSQKTLLVRN